MAVYLFLVLTLGGCAGAFGRGEVPDVEGVWAGQFAVEEDEEPEGERGIDWEGLFDREDEPECYFELSLARTGAAMPVEGNVSGSGFFVFPQGSADLARRAGFEPDVRVPLEADGRYSGGSFYEDGSLTLEFFGPAPGAYGPQGPTKPESFRTSFQVEVDPSGVMSGQVLVQSLYTAEPGSMRPAWGFVTEELEMKKR